MLSWSNGQFTYAACHPSSDSDSHLSCLCSEHQRVFYLWIRFPIFLSPSRVWVENGLRFKISQIQIRTCMLILTNFVCLFDQWYFTNTALLSSCRQVIVTAIVTPPPTSSEHPRPVHRRSRSRPYHSSHVSSVKPHRWMINNNGMELNHWKE